MYGQGKTHRFGTPFINPPDGSMRFRLEVANVKYGQIRPYSCEVRFADGLPVEFSAKPLPVEIVKRVRTIRHIEVVRK